MRLASLLLLSVFLLSLRAIPVATPLFVLLTDQSAKRSTSRFSDTQTQIYRARYVARAEFQIRLVRTRPGLARVVEFGHVCVGPCNRLPRMSMTRIDQDPSRVGCLAAVRTRCLDNR